MEFLGKEEVEIGPPDRRHKFPKMDWMRAHDVKYFTWSVALRRTTNGG